MKGEKTMYDYEAIGKAVILNLDIYEKGAKEAAKLYPENLTLAELLYWQQGYRLLKRLAEEGKEICGNN